MPIVRWHGWAAKCRRCGQLVDPGEGLAWSERDHVLESLDWTPRSGERLDEVITAVCGCTRRSTLQEPS